MSLTKLEVLNLDLPIGSYKNHKSAFKTVFLNYPKEQQPLTCGTRLSADPTGQRDETEDTAATARKTAQLADGDLTGDENGTNVTA